jgi:2'-5' RNA ligase
MSVFLGWRPDAATQAALAVLRDRTAAGLPVDAPRHDWRVPAQWHMTLRYFGDAVDDAQRASLGLAMEAFATRTSAATATLMGAAYWPRSRVLVATVDPAPALAMMLARLEDVAQACGWATREPQRAHITLARLPRDTDLGQVHEAVPATPLRIDRIDLLQTVPGGYMSLASWRLAPGTTAA